MLILFPFYLVGAIIIATKKKEIINQKSMPNIIMSTLIYALMYYYFTVKRDDVITLFVVFVLIIFMSAVQLWINIRKKQVYVIEYRIYLYNKIKYVSEKEPIKVDDFYEISLYNKNSNTRSIIMIPKDRLYKIIHKPIEFITDKYEHLF
jgi:hypothetical protein